MRNKRVGVIGIGLEKLKETFGTTALNLSGKNFGNILFTNAIYQQVPNSQHIGFHFSPDKVKREFSHLIIPAANWINTKEDWGWLADLIKETDLPTSIIGLGTQLKSVNEIDLIPSGTLKLLTEICKRSYSVGVRGEFTKEVLKRLGFTSVIALGCPSIFTSLSVPEVRNLPGKRALRLGIGSTRYELPKEINGDNNDKQMELYRFAISRANSIYYQSEQFEISLMNREAVSDENIKRATKYYGLKTYQDLELAIMSKGKYHRDINQWICDAKRDDVFIGTRIHGAIASVLSGTPAVLLTHDNRTSELASIMGIPSSSLNDADELFSGNYKDFVSQHDFSLLSKQGEINMKLLKDFYSNNGLSTNFS